MFERFLEIFSSALAGLYAVIPSYGVSIILLTLLVRVLLLPLSIKQTRSMREMQRIQPDVKQIQARNKGNRQKTNEEMMALYKEHGVNPFGGCLPLLMQFPALIGLFYVIRDPLTHLGYSFVEGAWRAIPTEQVSWLVERVQSSAFARELIQSPATVNQFFPGLRLDCSLQASIQQAGSRSVPAACGTGLLSTLPYVALVLFMGFTTYYQQRQMQSSQDTSSPQAQQMQTFAKIMPFMLMFFAFSFPTGVVIYWLTTNVWMIVQQRLILKAAPPLLPHLHHGDAPQETPKPKSTPKGAATPRPKSNDGAAQPGARRKPAAPRPPQGQTNGDERPAAASSRSPNASKKKRRK
jgi:YidC/Oxa1 family membrane protein insertase